MKHISFVIGGMNRGGAERVISILANYYASKYWKVDILMLLYDEVEYELDSRINIVHVSPGSEKRVSGLLFWLKRLRLFFKENNPDVIVSFVARINLIVLLSTIGLSKRVIISERNDPANDGRSFLVDLLTKLIYQRANRIIFQTKKAKEYFNKSIQKKGVIIPNPITVYSHAHTSKHKIVAVGRLAEQKNHKLLINAFAKVEKIHPNYDLWIYGDGPLKCELEKMIVGFDLVSKIHLPGNVPNIHEQISDAEMFVLTSNYEGLSNALLEAMTMGLACISTNCAGADEYIQNGVNGIIVPIDDEAQLIKAINNLIDDQGLREHIACNAKKISQKCSTNSILIKWAETIEIDNC